LGGRVTEIRRIMTKKDGRTMLAVQLEDLLGGLEVVVFPKTYDATADVWREDAVLLVTGNVKMRDDEPQLVCESVEAFVATDEEVNRRQYLVRIRLQRTKNAIVDTTRVHDIVTALYDFPGDDSYELIVRNGHWETRLPAATGRQGVRFCPELQRQLEGILGPGSVEAIPIAPPA
jgi:DNA polymerase-3 subunit alpha